MIEFTESQREIDLWALRRARPHLFELVTVEARDDGKGEVTFWRLRPECRDFLAHDGAA
jgi:hypothetical protein